MAAARTSGLNRKQRKELARQIRSEDPGLEVMHPHAAGIDVGNSAHYVAVRPDRDPDSVRRFECFTADLHHLADWLQRCGVTTVAMQSTGVYWIPLYEILDARGFDVYLVNARHTKNLPGRKTDVQESQWLLKLHTYGLLRNSFHPPAEIRIVRTYWRQRGDHVHAVSTCIQRMQKALTQMNIQLANVISDLSGWTGQRIVRAMLAGERDPDTLAALSHPGIHATRDTIAKSLEGTWQPDLLFVLQQEVAMYDAYQQRIAECDQALERHLKGVADKVPDTTPDAEPSHAPSQEAQCLGAKRRRKAGSHAPQFDLGRELYRISGVDLTRIDGIDVGDRADSWDRNFGSRGGTSERDRNDERDPRDIFTRDLDLPRGRERRPAGDRDRVYEIDGAESRALATIGAFRVIAESDLHDIRDDSQSSRRTLKHLENEGLIRTSPLSSDDRAVTLTDRGRDLLEANRFERDDRIQQPRQTFYAGVRKPRELTHDTKVYRAYQRAEERLRGHGGRVRRVVLDYELKRDYQRFLHQRNRGKKDCDGRPDRE